jgi:DNA-binding beta-propeller fold protein YncE
MKCHGRVALAGIAALFTATSLARAEMLASVVYETKAEESIRALRVEGANRPREDGLAIIDVDPASDAYGKILAKFPLPEGLAPHHQYYNPDKTKIYVTGTLLPMLHVVDLTRAPYRIKRIDTPGCQNLDQVVFSSDKKTWWVTCNETAKVLVGDAITDRPVGEILIPDSGPHGIALHEGIDRLIVASLGSIENLDDKIIVIEASTGTVLSRHKVSNRPSPARVGPVGVRFIRDWDPPFAYVNIDAGGWDRKGSLWAAIWNPDNKDFEVREVFDFGPTGGALPVAMGFDRTQERMFVSTAIPGLFHVFDISGDPLKPKLLKTLPAAQGAHHVALSPDERYAFVQNGVLNLPGFSDGAITVIDLEKLEVVDSIDTFKDAGYAINHILMLPE